MARASNIGYSSGWYDRSKSEICLKSWQDDCDIERIKFAWYLYVRAEDYNEVSCRELDGMVDSVEVCDEGKHYKLTTGARTREQQNEIVEWFRKRDIEPFEGDVDPLTRYLTDNPIKFAKPRILFYDIETDSRKGFITRADGKTMPNPDGRILSIAWGGLDGCVDVEVADSTTDVAESHVLETFFEAVASADLLVAWNGDGFDQLVLQGRAKRLANTLGYVPAWHMVNFLDLMLLFKHPYFGYGRDSEASGVKTSYALDNIAKTVLGKGKTEGVSGAKVYELWCRDKGKLAQYNVQDTKLLIELEQAKRYIEGFETLCHTCNRFVSSVCLHAGYANDGFMLRYGASHGIRLATKKEVDKDEEREQLEGAFVFEPKAGLHEGVCAVDFAALYPSIIRTFNISPETRVEKSYNGKVAVAANEARFRVDVDGVVPSVVALCTANRAKYRAEAKRLAGIGQEGSDEQRLAKTRSDSWKVVQNSLYGLMGSPYSRIFSPECTEAVTKSGQQIIKKVAVLAESSGLPVLAGDTDSAYLHGRVEKVREFMGEAAIKTDEWVVSRGAKPGFIRLDLDAEYKRIFWSSKNDGTPAKKKYAGLKTTGKMDIKGLELVRTDGCRYRREFQREVIHYVLHSEKPDVEESDRLVRHWASKLYGMKVAVEDLAITAGLSKMPGEYKSDIPQVRVAKKMIAAGKEVFVGMKIAYVVVGAVAGERGKGKKMEVVHVDDYAGVYDAGHYWREQVYPGVQRVLCAVFPEESDRWERLTKYDPDDRQAGMFAVKASRLVLRLGEGDMGLMESIKGAAEMCYNGGIGLPLWLELPGENLYDTRLQLTRARQFVRDVEAVAGHRLYFGTDDELGQ